MQILRRSKVPAYGSRMLLSSCRNNREARDAAINSLYEDDHSWRKRDSRNRERQVMKRKTIWTERRQLNGRSLNGPRGFSRRAEWFFWVLESRNPWRAISLGQLEQVAFIVAMTVRHWAGL
jgi:hypothetical protein